MPLRPCLRGHAVQQQARSGGEPDHFHRVSSDLIHPALEKAGPEPSCADEEGRTGDIHTDMFQELLLQDQGFRPEAVGAGIDILDRCIERTAPVAAGWQPGQVNLFSDHMMDAPDRTETPLPCRHGAEDIAFRQAAAGGDPLFLEACQQGQVRCQVLLPFEAAECLQRSVLPMRLMPVELGPLPAIVHTDERCNLWLLQSALACGVDRVRFITLWNGGGGDGPGGIRGLISVEILASQEKELRQQLRQPDFTDCDPDDGIQLGECWRDTLYDRLRLSIAVIVIGSEAHACSQWCLVELGIASLHARA